MAEPAPQVYCSADGPVSVWACAQQPGPVQRRNRYLPESAAHPAKMLPALARQAIATYTAPGELVLDPMCGIGTTVVEAVHLGRDGLGVDFEPRWAALAQANVDLARSQGARRPAGTYPAAAPGSSAPAPRTCRRRTCWACRGGSPSPSKPDGWILGSAVVWPKPTPCPTAWCRPPARCEPALRPTA
jgi:DNA methylase